MSFAADVYRLFISSPSDCADDRASVEQVVNDWNRLHAFHQGIVILPFSQRDAVPMQGGDPQSFIDDQLVLNCDLLIAMFRRTIGTPTKSQLSGTVQEIELFREMKARRLMLYVMNDPSDPSQALGFEAVKAYVDSISHKGLYQRFETTKHLLGLVANDLMSTVYRFKDAIPIRALRDTLIPRVGEWSAVSRSTDSVTEQGFSVLKLMQADLEGFRKTQVFGGIDLTAQTLADKIGELRRQGEINVRALPRSTIDIVISDLEDFVGLLRHEEEWL